jgi:thiol peroxidase
MAKVTLKGNPVNTVGNLPQVGSKAPDFKLVKTDLSEVSLNDHKGKKVVLNIFPSVDTSTCAASVRQFNTKAASADNTIILCVSADLPFAHSRFCGAEGISNVESLSNFRDNGSFGNNYGVTFVDGPLKGLTARAVVVIDENGIVKYTELVPEIVDEPNYESALKSL